MTKKEYQKPAILVVSIQQQTQLLTDSTFTTLQADVDGESESELIYEGMDKLYDGGAR